MLVYVLYTDDIGIVGRSPTKRAAVYEHGVRAIVVLAILRTMRHSDVTQDRNAGYQCFYLKSDRFWLQKKTSSSAKHTSADELRRYGLLVELVTLGLSLIAGVFCRNLCIVCNVC